VKPPPGAAAKENIMFQLVHYDVIIPQSEQPTCPDCGGPMHIRIHPRSYVAEWSCLRGGCGGIVKDVDAAHIDDIDKEGWPISRPSAGEE